MCALQAANGRVASRNGSVVLKEEIRPDDTTHDRSFSRALGRGPVISQVGTAPFNRGLAATIDARHAEVQ